MIIDGDGRPLNGFEPETRWKLVLCIYDKELFYLLVLGREFD